MATFYERPTQKLAVGDSVTYYDNGKFWYPEQAINGMVEGVVKEVGDEGFTVLWDDFKELGWTTEYDWAKVEIKGGQIFENGQRDELKKEAIQKDAENQLLCHINNLCIESLPPDYFEKWEDVKNMLVINRNIRALSVEINNVKAEK